MWGRTRACSALASLLIAIGADILGSAPVAAGAYCPNPGVCYSILEGVGTAYIGMGGHWNRANMSTPSSQQVDYFINSEMWLKPDCSTNVWVEEGITLWWDPIIHSGAYETFFAYNTPGQSYAETAQEYILPTNERADFKIFRGAYANTWTGTWDSNANYNRTTADEGFWTSYCLQMGGEVWSSNGHADTFNMYGYAVNAAGQNVNWGTQGGVITDTAQFNGFSYSNSEWSWNTVT